MNADAVNAAMGSRSDWKKLQNELKAKGAVTTGAIRLLIEKKRQESEGGSVFDLRDYLEKEPGPARQGSIVAAQISNLVENASFMLKDALEFSKGTRLQDDELIVGLNPVKHRRRSVGATSLTPNRKDTSSLGGSSLHSKGERSNSTSTTASTASSVSSFQQRRGSPFGMMSNTGSASLSNSNYYLRAGGSSSDVINLANFKNPADMRNAQFSATNGFAARTSTLGRLFGTNRDGDGILSPNDLGMATKRSTLQRTSSTGSNLGSRSGHAKKSSLSNGRSRRSSRAGLGSLSTHSYLKEKENQMLRCTSGDDLVDISSHSNSRRERAQRSLKMLFGRKEDDSDDDDSCSGSIGEFGVDNEEHSAR